MAMATLRLASGGDTRVHSCLHGHPATSPLTALHQGLVLCFGAGGEGNGRPVHRRGGSSWGLLNAWPWFTIHTDPELIWAPGPRDTHRTLVEGFGSNRCSTCR